MLLLSSCKGIRITGKTIKTEGFTESQTMCIVASERNRYRDILSEDIFETEIESEDRSFGENLLKNIKEYLEKVKTLLIYAEEKGVVISSEDSGKASKMAEDFYNSLTDSDREYMKDPTVEEIEELYYDLIVSENAADYLLKSSLREISDLEAKVFQISLLEFDDLYTASEILFEIKEKKKDLSDYKGDSGMKYSVLTLYNSSEPDRITEEGAKLDTGEISEIVSENGKYYILQALNGYMEELTEKRKEEMEKEQKEEIFNSGLKTFSDENIVRFSDEYWNKIDLSKNPESQNKSFFEIYRKYMEKEDV